MNSFPVAPAAMHMVATVDNVQGNVQGNAHGGHLISRQINRRFLGSYRQVRVSFFILKFLEFLQFINLAKECKWLGKVRIKARLRHRVKPSDRLRHQVKLLDPLNRQVNSANSAPVRLSDQTDSWRKEAGGSSRLLGTEFNY